ncbi:MAG: glycosyltransferase family 4 protein [Planctomycetota bacterium]|jgi:hypothetical protein
MHIYQLGYPGAMGGANTEAWHTVRLWREAGWNVTMIPTWGADSHWEERLASIGVRTHHVSVDRLETVPGLPGSIVVGMCNQHFCRTREPATGGVTEPVRAGQTWWNFGRLKAIGCRTVWVPCMTFIFGWETTAWMRFGLPDALMFQSEFQRARFAIALKQYGYRDEQGFVIRGAFCPDEFPFRPRQHAPGDPFVVGKLARPDPDKWSSNHWPIVARVPYANRRALCMGWTPQLEHKLGRLPEWAECLPPQEIPVAEFLARCHSMLAVNGGALENWPRVGLEAMAAGVPIVAPNAWGWQEMIEHDVNGYLCDTDAELSYWPAYLAHHEARRLELAEAARAHVERLSSPAPILAGWERLFRHASSNKTADLAPVP